MCGQGHERDENTDHHVHGHIEVPQEFLTRRGFLVVGAAGLGAAVLSACRQSAPSAGETSVSGVSTTTTSTLGISKTTTSTPDSTTASTPGTLAGFDEFESTVSVLRDGEWWLVESSGMPAHNMMVGITSWQQQVPTPQPYAGSNAWRIPATPVISKAPVSARTALYRGAIALAANGVPIFNALNNRGEDANLAGELDKWGGHAGKADDYHYHVAPLHLADVVGHHKPIAYALDGFPIYGETEPDGSRMKALDEFNGHFDADGGYHYHGTRTYPYINGGLRGRINVVGDQVDPQPTTKPFRPSLEPLRGAIVTSFSSPTKNSYVLGYSSPAGNGEISYAVTETEATFTFTGADGSVVRERYARR